MIIEKYGFLVPSLPCEIKSIDVLRESIDFHRLKFLALIVLVLRAYFWEDIESLQIRNTFILEHSKEGYLWCLMKSLRVDQEICIAIDSSRTLNEGLKSVIITSGSLKDDYWIDWFYTDRESYFNTIIQLEVELKTLCSSFQDVQELIDSIEIRPLTNHSE